MVEKLKIVGCAILERPSNHFFTLDQMIEITGLDRTEVRRALEQFSREKLVLKITKMPNYFKGEIAIPRGRPPLSITYHIAGKKRFAKRIAPKLKENTALDRMWSVIRNKSEMDGYFRVRDIINLANVGKENTRSFIKALRSAGIVRNVGYRDWVLVRDPGPRRPYIPKG